MYTHSLCLMTVPLTHTIRPVDALCMSERARVCEEVFRMPLVSLLRVPVCEEEGVANEEGATGDHDTESEMGEDEPQSVGALTHDASSTVTTGSHLVFLSDQVSRCSAHTRTHTHTHTHTHTRARRTLVMVRMWSQFLMTSPSVSHMMRMPYWTRHLHTELHLASIGPFPSHVLSTLITHHPHGSPEPALWQEGTNTECPSILLGLNDIL